MPKAGMEVQLTMRLVLEETATQVSCFLSLMSDLLPCPKIFGDLKPLGFSFLSNNNAKE